MASFNLDQPQKGTYHPLLPELSLSKERLFNHNLITVYSDAILSSKAGGVIGPMDQETPIVPLVAENISIVSDDANDSATGTGARRLQILGLDLDFNPIQESIELDGTTPVVTSQQFLRINRLLVSSTGEDLVNQGKITATCTEGDMTAIMPLRGTSNNSFTTVPNGMEAYMYNYNWSAGRKQSTVVEFSVNLVTPSVYTGDRVQRHLKFSTGNTTGGSTGDINFIMPPVLPEKTDFWFSAASDTNQDLNVVTMATVVLVDNQNRQLPTSALY